MPTKEEVKKFSYEIDRLVSVTGYTYLEAIVEHCNNTGLEIEVAATLLTTELKSKIERQALEQNQLKEKLNRLPI